MDRLRVKKMTNNEIINTVTPATNMFRIQNQLTLIKFAFDASDEAQAQAEKDQQKKQVENHKILSNLEQAEIRRVITKRNVCIIMQYLKGAEWQEQKEDFLDVRTLRGVFPILESKEDKDKN